MRGYRLDDQRRPTFLYSIGGVSVEEQFVPVPREPEPGFRRTFTLTSDTVLPSLWLRAAVGNTIEIKDGGYVVDDKLFLKFTLEAGAQPRIRKVAEQSELLVPVSPTGTRSRIVEEINW